jgi:glycosyltransferase involved in cell wall biosynthesis
MTDERRWNNLVYFNRLRASSWFFCLGHTPELLAPYGGVETTYIALPEALAAMGRRVFVFARVAEPHERNGVFYIPHEQIGEYADVCPQHVVASRWFEPFQMFPQAKKILWLQDAHYPDAPHHQADLVVVSSPWHRDYSLLRGIPADKLTVIPLGIHKQMFRPQERRRSICLYSHNPNRGLDILMELWPRIRKQCPGAGLVITYGWDGLLTWSDDPAWREQVVSHRQLVEQWARKNSAVVLGRLEKQELYNLMGISRLSLYPCTFWETFCLTALETQASGVPMITTRLGALPTTLGPGNVLIDGDPYSQEYGETFVDAAVHLLSDGCAWQEKSQLCLQYIQISPVDWRDIASEWIRTVEVK